MSSNENEVGLGLNSETLDAELNEVDRKLNLMHRKTLNIVRNGFNTLVTFTTVAGVAIDQTYQLMAQSVFTAIETTLQVQAALAAGTFGASTLITGFLGFSTAALLMAQAANIRANQRDALLQNQNLILLANSIRWTATI